MLGWTLLSLTLAQTLTPPPPVPLPQTRIQGRVLDSNTGLGIPRATVTLKHLEGKQAPALWLRTSPTGDFAFDDLAPGLYIASAERNGYSATVSSNLSAGTERRVYLEKDQNITDFVIRLAPHAVISGKVVDDLDDPIPFAAVQAMRCQVTTYDPLCETASVGITNDLGEYRLAFLPPGRYVVRAEGSAFREGLTPATAVGVDADSQLVSTYFPETPDPSLATVVDVAAGKQVGGIEIRLERAPVRLIRGRVSPVLGQVMVEFVSPWFGRGQNPYRQSAATDREGRFAIRLPEGPYSVIALSKGGDRPLEHRSRFRVRGDQENLIVALTPLAGVQVTVKWPESGPSPNLRVDLRPLPGQWLGTSPFGSVDQLNLVQIEEIPGGEYGVRVTGLPPDRYVKSLRVGGIEAEKAVIGSGSRVSMEIEIAEPAGQIEGVTVNRQGRRTPATQVLVWKLGSPSPVPRIVLTDGNGDWSLAGLSPGEYRLLAVESLETDLDAGWLSRQDTKAEPVTLHEGERAGRILLTHPAP